MTEDKEKVDDVEAAVSASWENRQLNCTSQLEGLTHGTILSDFEFTSPRRLLVRRPF